MDDLYILDYKPRELQIIEEPHKVITQLLRNSDSTVSVVYHDGDRYCIITVDEDGLDIHGDLKIHPRPTKSKFIFPSGAGEAVGKSFKTRGGYHLICISDLRLYTHIVCDCSTPLITVNEQGSIFEHTIKGSYLSDIAEDNFDIIDYWIEGE